MDVRLRHDVTLVVFSFPACNHHIRQYESGISHNGLNFINIYVYSLSMNQSTYGTGMEGKRVSRYRVARHTRRGQDDLYTLESEGHLRQVNNEQGAGERPTQLIAISYLYTKKQASTEPGTRNHERRDRCSRDEAVVS